MRIFIRTVDSLVLVVVDLSLFCLLSRLGSYRTKENLTVDAVMTASVVYLNSSGSGVV